MKLTLQKPDTIGALASALCMAHCIATPLLFIVQTHTITGNSSIPIWWKWMDYFFLAVSFLAVYRSSQTTSNNNIKNALWITWGALTILIINEKAELFHLPEFITYIIASLLIFLHLYNRKYCQCKSNKCCI
jgi:glucan phosphoethanolaminetransferase (alkaline phosphatase superfamily)